MTAGRGLAVAVALVAAPVVAEELALARRGWPLISHLWWPAVEDATLRPAALAVWTTLSFHLLIPRRSWWAACGAGAACGLSVRYVARIATGRVLP